MNIHKNIDTIWRKTVRILFLVFTGLLVLGQFQKIFLSRLSAMYFHDIVVVVLVGLAMPLVKKHWKKLTKPLWVRWLGTFLLITLISLLLALLFNPFSDWMIGMLYVVRLIAYVLFGGATLLYIHEKALSREEVFALCLSVTTLIAAAGLVQYVAIPDVRGLQYVGWDDHYLRLVSTLFDPSFTGIIAVIGFFLALHRFIQRKSAKYIAIACVHLFALLLTYSRASYLAFSVALIVCAFEYARLRKAIFVIALATIVGVLLLPRPASEGTRLERLTSVRARIWNTTSAIQRLSPKTLFIGNGWYLTNVGRKNNNILSETSHSSSPDNSFIHVLQSTGSMGLGSLLITGIVLFRSTKSLALRSTLVAITIASFFNQVLFYPWVLLIVCELIAQDEEVWA